MSSRDSEREPVVARALWRMGRPATRPSEPTWDAAKQVPAAMTRGTPHATIFGMAHVFDQAKTLQRREVWRGSVGRFGEEEVLLPDGRQFTLGILNHPGACAVVPLLDDGRVMLLRQYRHAVRQTLWEIPAGKLDQGEGREACALRELREETGFHAGQLVSLGTICVTPGYSDEQIHLFLARELTAGAQALTDNESIVCVPLPLAEAVAMAEQGEISDAKTAIALLRARLL